jgi:hypothetical protein
MEQCQPGAAPYGSQGRVLPLVTRHSPLPHNRCAPAGDVCGSLCATRESNDNFVYGFYNSNGQPQEPGNPKSDGAMFFYEVPGGQNGIPFQPAIHWGPSDVCWLQHYAGLKCSGEK